MASTPTFSARMCLESVPNGDFPVGQRGPRIGPRLVAVSCLDEARRVLADFIVAHDLGGGNMTSETGRCWCGETPVGRVAYNGRWIEA